MFKSLALKHGAGKAVVVETLVELDEAVHLGGLLRGVEVSLVEEQDDGDAVGLGHGQEAVEEGGADGGVGDGDEEKDLVDVGGQDVALL